MQAPIAKTIPQVLEIHGHQRTDHYYWLNQRENPEVLAYLKAENAYLEAVMAPTATLQNRLFDEMKGRIKEEDQSVPYFYNGYHYYSRYEAGREYPLYCRKPGTLAAAEQLLLDVNQLAQGHAYYQVGEIGVSDDNQWLAYSADTQSRRIYTIYFKNLLTGETLPTAIADVTGNLAWAANNQTLFYTKQDPETLRPYQVWRHQLGTPPGADALVYQEDDETFHLQVGRSKSRQYVFITADSTLTSEVHYLPATEPTGAWRVFQPRQRGHEYSVEHAGGHFYIRTNLNEATNFKLMQVADQPITTAQHWQDLIAHRPEVFLEGFDVFTDFLVLEERHEGLVRLRARRWDGTDDHYLHFEEPTYTAGLGHNPEFATAQLRYGYTSLTTPSSTFDYDLATRQTTLLKQQPVLGGFDQTQYVSERLYAPARDGARVPVSLVRRRDTPVDGTAPLLLYAYGSYGISLDAYFSSNRLSLLDRGFVYAIAHIRGGQELGRPWYESGKLRQKMNTFSDYIDCAEHLVAQRYTQPGRLFGMGGSAGGLLMGAVANLRPDLFCGLVAQVPFVDVVTTMLDDSVPLTTGEYDEWGNPNQKPDYDYMLSYSPYDNVARQAYPHLLVTTGLHDSQVQYWEPAKWVAKLRTHQTDPTRRLLLKTNLEAGHGGASGRFAPLREIALEYAFLLELAGRLA
ncbi:MAG: S9 family peptidase [Bernardetiaceae bacterium]|jgi:oligopeptidase B|nr:S9 family peptidase [Bernardetiaceae bacterium]